MSKPVYIVALVCITLCGALVRFVQLDAFPLRLDGDAARFSLEGMNVIKNQAPFFATGWEGHTHAWFYIVGWVSQLFDNPALGVRVLSATTGALAVATTAYFAHSLSNNRAISLVAATCLAFSPLHLVFSRNGMELTWGTFLLPLILALMRHPRPLAWGAAGVFTAIAQYIAMSLRIAPIAVVALLLILFFHKQLSVRQLISRIAIWGSCAVLVYAPQLSYYFQNPDTYVARIKRVSIFTPEHMGALLQTHASYGAIALHQITHAYSPFFLDPGDTPRLWYFYLPYLNPLPMIFFAAGLVYMALRIRQWQMQFLACIIMGTIFMASVFTTNAPMSSRYVILFPFVSIVMSYGLLKSFQLLIQTRMNSAVVWVVFAVVCTVGLLADAISYIRHDTQAIWHHDISTQTASLTTHYLWENPRILTLYTPSPEVLFPTVQAYTEVEVVAATPYPPQAHTGAALLVATADLTYVNVAQQSFGWQTIRELTNPAGQVVGYVLLP